MIRKTPDIALFSLTILFAPLQPVASAHVCQEVEALEEFSASDQAASVYFDKFLVKASEGVLHVRFRKRLQLDFSSTKQVLNNLEGYPQFMPGFEAIKVRRNSDGELLAGIRFRPPYAVLVARFTSEFEVDDGTHTYKQCWRQLAEEDDRAIEVDKGAPVVNKGYWRVERRNNEIEINYFSAVQPYLPIPTWLYRHIVVGSFEETCQKLVERTRQSLATVKGVQATNRTRVNGEQRPSGLSAAPGQL